MDIVFDESEEEFENDDESEDEDNESSEEETEESDVVEEIESVENESEEEEKSEDEFLNDEGNEEGIDLDLYQEETAKKNKTLCMNRKRRTKPPKVSKQIRKRKKKKDEEIVLNYSTLSFEEMREKAVELVGSKLEKSIYNYLVKSLELLFKRKVKKSDLNSDYFKEKYIFFLYECFITDKNIVEKFSINNIPTNITEDKIVRNLDSVIFKDEEFKDEQETKVIEEPLKVKPGIHKCESKKCKKEKKGQHTFSIQMQTRSSDEPMTCFVWCMDCGNKWVTS